MKFYIQDSKKGLVSGPTHHMFINEQNQPCPTKCTLIANKMDTTSCAL